MTSSNAYANIACRSPLSKFSWVVLFDIAAASRSLEHITKIKDLPPAEEFSFLETHHENPFPTKTTLRISEMMHLHIRCQMYVRLSEYILLMHRRGST